MTRRTTSSGGPGSSEGARLTTDQVFEILRERRRRQVVELLCDADGPVTLSALTEQVEAGDAAGQVERATAVVLDHVPRLAEAGVVEYDRDDGTVRYRGDRRLESLLEAVGGD